MEYVQGSPSLYGFDVVSGPAHLPDPGIPVYVRMRQDDHPFHNKIAILNSSRKVFVLAHYGQAASQVVSVDGVKGWDYAVPAGDLL